MTEKDIVYFKPKRSAFLTILCFLTFIGSSFYIVKYVQAFRDAQSMAKDANEKIERSRPKRGAVSSDSYANKILEESKAQTQESTTKRFSFIMVIGNFLTLAGAVLMFSLNRKGFYSYILGTLIIFGTPLVLYGANSIPGIISAVPQLLISLAFIVMYGINLKNMGGNHRNAQGYKQTAG